MRSVALTLIDEQSSCGDCVVEMSGSKRIVNSVRDWFNEPEQVRHYETEAPRGLGPDEEWLLQTLKGTREILDVGCGAGR